MAGIDEVARRQQNPAPDPVDDGGEQAPAPTDSGAPAPTPTSGRSSKWATMLDGVETSNAVDALEVEGGVDADNVRSTLQGLGRLYYSAKENDDKDTLTYIADNLKQLEGLYTEADLVAVGMEGFSEYESDGPGIWGKIGQAAGMTQLGTAVNYAADIGRGFTDAWALANVDGSEQGDHMWASIGRGLTGQDRAEGLYGKLDTIDQDGDGYINFRETFGMDSNAGEFDDATGSWLDAKSYAGYGVGFLDTVGMALVDPTTWIGLGATSKAKAGMEAVEHVAGKGGVAIVRRRGLKGLTAVQRAEINQVIIERTGAGLGKARAVRKAKAQVDAISRPSRAVSFAGSGIPTPLDKPFNYIRSKASRQYGDLTRNADSALSAGNRYDRIAADAAAAAAKKAGNVSSNVPPQFQQYAPTSATVPKAAARPNIPDEVGWFAEQTRQGVGDLLLGTPVLGKTIKGARSLLDAVTPRAAIKRLSAKLGQRVDDVRVGVAGASARLADDIEREMLRPRTLAAEEVGKRTGIIGSIMGDPIDEAIEKADRHVREVLEGGLGGNISAADHATAAIANLRARGLDAVADYAEVAVGIRAKLNEAATTAGLKDMVEHYFPRVLTLDGKKAVLQNTDDVAGKLGYSDAAISRGELGFQKARSADTAEIQLTQLNERFAQYVPDGGDFFEGDVIRAMKSRADHSYRAALLEKELLDMSDEMVDGIPMVLRNATDKELKLANSGREGIDQYVPLKTSGGTVHVPQSVEKAFNEINAVVINDAALKTFNEAVQAQSKIWGSWATSPVIDGVGFHSRNGLGNVLLNAAKGVVNPASYTKAGRLQMNLAKANNNALRDGVPLDEALRGLKGLSARDADLLISASDNQIFNGLMEDLTLGEGASTYLRVLGDNALIRSGRALGNAIEDNARLAHYIHQVGQGMSPQQAARSVRETLFDYGDLTEMERKARVLSRFYTFTRKNTGFQIWAMAHYPGRVANLEEALGQTRDAGLGSQQAGYSAERGDSFVNPLGFGGLVAGFDTPFGAAMDTLKPFINLAGVITGQSDQTAKEVAVDWMGLTSGGPRALADVAYEALTGVDPFTGAPSKSGEEEWAMGFVDALVGPAWSQFDTMVSKITNGTGDVDVPFTEWNLKAGDIGLGNTSTSVTRAGLGPEAFVLSGLIGMTTAPYGGSQVNNSMFQMQDEIEAALKEIPNSPTVEQLRRADLWPEREASTPRAQEDILNEKIAADKASGIPTDELENELAYVTFAQSNGLLTESGNVSRDRWAMASWNASNPGNLLYNEDPDSDGYGQPWSIYDAPVQWGGTRISEVYDWATANGVELTAKGNVGKAAIDAWNATNSSRPFYRTGEERADAGFIPTEGVFVYDDGREVAAPMAGGGRSAPRGQASLSGPSGSSALVLGGQRNASAALLDDG